MPPSRLTPRWHRRADARPGELLGAALAVFVERGYAATHLDEVARRAGVSKGTLYLYYANKAELFKAVVRSTLLPGLDEVAAHLGRHQGSSRERLTAFLTELNGCASDSSLSGIPKLVMAEAGNFPEIACFFFDEVIRRGRDTIQGILREGIADGEFRQVDVDYAWRVVVAPLMLGILWKHTFLHCDSAGFDFERHLQSHLDVLFDGLATPRGTRQQDKKDKE